MNLILKRGLENISFKKEEIYFNHPFFSTPSPSLRNCMTQLKPIMIPMDKKNITVRVLSLLEQDGNLHFVNWKLLK